LEAAKSAVYETNQANSDDYMYKGGGALDGGEPNMKDLNI
jgi:hypothetical protein